jgi:hypothetical protein
LSDERLAWLTLNIEAALKDFAEKHPGFKDKDTLLALEYAKNRVEKGRSLIILAGDEGRVRNEAGEAIVQSLNQCRFQRKIFLPQNLETYTSEEKIKCLDNTILAVKHLAQEHLEDRTYLRDLARRWTRLQESAGRDKIITPT